MRPTNVFTRKAIVVILLMCCFTVVYSQDSDMQSIPPSPSWKLNFRQDGCEIYTKKEICDMVQDGITKEEIYFQLKNVSNDTIQVTYDLVLFYGSRCYNCNFDNDELKLSITLLPNQSVEGICGDNNVKRLKVFSRFLTGESEVKLTDYQVKNLKITII